jgi:PD-(D/E)XK nuclease superfamily protein
VSEVWSPSRVLSYRSCPRQEFLRYRRGPQGPLPAELPTTATTEEPRGASKLVLGTVTHAGLEAAYRVAAGMTVHLSGSRMSMFAETAMEAVNTAWDRLGLPAEGVEGFELMHSIESEVFDVLSRLPVPTPASIVGIEHELLVPTPSGRMERGTLDLALRTGADSLHIRDWKRRRLRNLPKSTELPRDDALGFYAFAARRYWPWARRVSVGLYSTLDNREVTADLTLPVATEVVIGHDVLAEIAEGDRERRPTPDGDNCTHCSVRNDCPLWTRLHKTTAGSA